MAQRILVVDDSKENRFIVKTCLVAEGFTVHELSSGEELLEMGNQIKDFDLILLDVMMPSLNGYETCRRLKSSMLANNVPVIFLSAETDEDSRVSGFEAGGVDYILKPFGRKELGMRIKSHLALSGSFKAIKRENETLAANLREGASTQAAFLPDPNFSHPGMKISWNYRPAEHIAGDMFGFLNFDDGSLGVYLLDVCGHGSSAALVASAVHGALNSNKRISGKLEGSKIFPLEPAKVIENLNAEFPFERFERYFTFLYVLVKPETKKIFCASSGHPAPYFLSAATTSCSKLPVVGKILGLSLDDKWHQIEQDFRMLDKLLLFSDGVLETKNNIGVPYEAEIETDLLKYRNLNCKEIVSILQTTVQKYSDAANLDDQTIICIEFN